VPLMLRPLSKDDPRVAVPLYTLSEASRYLGVPRSTLHGWARPRDGEPLVTSYRTAGYEPSIPFVGFAEAFVIKVAERAGVPRRLIRPGVEAIRRGAGGVEHALASRIVYTDGAEILLGELGQDMWVARTNQQQFTETVRDQLRLITYAGDGFAVRLRLPTYQSEVTVDPRVASGSPLLESGGARLEDLIDRSIGGDSAESIARDFDAPLNEVKEILGRA
jgi:hypothetical protein